MLFVVRFMLSIGRLRTSPVDVMIPRHWIPGGGELIHRPVKLVRLDQPLGPTVITLDQIAHRHGQIRIDQIHLLDSLSEDLDPFRWTSGAITHDGKLPHRFFYRRFQ